MAGWRPSRIVDPVALDARAEVRQSSVNMALAAMDSSRAFSLQPFGPIRALNLYMDEDPKAMPSEEELVEVFLRTRRESSFRALYRRHSPRLLAVAKRLLGRFGDEAEDIVQETWLHAVKGLARFEWRSTLGTWLVGILIRRCRARLARRGPGSSVVPDDVGLVTSSSDPRTDIRLDLERLVLGLPDGCRQILVLHDVEGLTHEEISQHLGISPGTSKSQLSFAREKLRKQLNRTERLLHGR